MDEIVNPTDTTVSRIISAPVEKVYNVWMNKDVPGGPWFGAQRVIIDPIVDGLFYLAVQYEGRVWPHYGRFLQIERPHLIEHTWVSEGTKGIESVVTVTFEASGDHTLVTLRHSGMPDPDMGRQHADGWTRLLSMLAEQFATNEANPWSN